VITSWEQWGSVFTDAAIWTPGVREIGRRAGLPVTTVEAGYPGTNAVFIVNAGAAADQASPPYVVKIYCPFCREDFALERILHPLLAEYADLPVPAWLGDGVLKGEMDWPYLILSFLPGKAIRDVRSKIPRANLVSIAAELGRCVKVLHGIPSSSLQSLDPFLDAWSVVAEQQLARTVDRLTTSQALPRNLIRQIPGFVTPVLESLSPLDWVSVNGDLTEDHVLLQEQRGHWRISGLIDFADTLIAPAEYEWVALWFGALGRDPACLHAFMQGYEAACPIDEAFRRRAMAFTFLHEFGALMIETVLQGLDAPEVRSLEHLETLLWPLC
jgi:hygromycin-B 7''-O-kinase